MDPTPTPDPSGGGTGTGFHNIDALPLGNLLKIKSEGRAKKSGKGLIRKLLTRGFNSVKPR